MEKQYGICKMSPYYGIEHFIIMQDVTAKKTTNQRYISY